MRDEITYPFLNFNGFTVEVEKWISNFIPHFKWMQLLIHAGIKNQSMDRGVFSTKPLSEEKLTNDYFGLRNEWAIWMYHESEYKGFVNKMHVNIVLKIFVYGTF